MQVDVKRVSKLDCHQRSDSAETFWRITLYLTDCGLTPMSYSNACFVRGQEAQSPARIERTTVHYITVDRRSVASGVKYEQDGL